MMSMALMYGGSTSAVNLGPSLCKVNSALNPIRRTPKQQQKLISNACFTIPPTFLRGDYGLWTTFLVFLVRLFYYIPWELELPFLFVLLVIIAPYQAMNLRGNQAGMVISIAASAYLMYQHVTRTGGIKKVFDQEVVVPTIVDACLICVSCIFLVKGYIF